MKSGRKKLPVRIPVAPPTEWHKDKKKYSRKCKHKKDWRDEKMAGCNKEIEVSVPSGYTAKLIKVKCGSTSPYGSPWLCEECEERYAGVDWRREAELAGEQWDDDY